MKDEKIFKYSKNEIDATFEKIEKIYNKNIEMFELQNKLNIKTAGKKWTNGITKEGRKINWNRCIYMECAEAIDSFNWKHWKNINNKDDIDNFIIEIVDIWHFIMSKLIEKFKDDIIVDLNKFIYLIFYPMNKNYLITLNLNKQELKEKLLEALENLMRNALNDKNCIMDFIYILNITELLYDFTFNDLYKIYIGKNCLNIFRQNNGYKNNTYKKEWEEGYEDNFFMQQYINENEEITYEGLYDFLTNKYKEII